MFTVGHLGLLFVCLHCSAADAALNPPHDLNVIALNTNYTLTWDWDQNHAGPDPVTFTVRCAGHHQLNRKKPRWTTACAETAGRSCDLTGLELLYLGMYVLQVRTNLNTSHSDWTSKTFCPDKEAAIGPPSKVRLGVAGSSLDVFISDPQSSSNSSMREMISDLYFQVRYWEQRADGEVEKPPLTAKGNMVTLSDLTPWTLYCVEVQSRYDFYNKSSSFTQPLCVKTEGFIPWWMIFLYFLGSLLICFLLVLIFIYGGHRCFQLCKETLCPGEKLPLQLRQDDSDYPCLIVSESESDLCDLVIVCSESAIQRNNADLAVDSAAPLIGLEEDSSGGGGRHSRHNSSGSRDSGVYSAGGNSGALPLGAASSSPDVSRLHDSEKMKMLSMSSEVKVPPVIPDEGVVDMEV
ncbi:interleukin-10 receptor subunit beta isoform X1 [Fundulus heteroclitus]|uniref:interleukin-10 receptor subunit beta isoform X1 n=1 Tax=Fundulus heteroclitus TaxID=8078 RepID=UPI00165AEEB2|nr:interleukin-10 receptor subunit beta isoform X1 [Fundulus heteroclitus]